MEPAAYAPAVGKGPFVKIATDGAIGIIGGAALLAVRPFRAHHGFCILGRLRAFSRRGHVGTGLDEAEAEASA